MLSPGSQIATTAGRSCLQSSVDVLATDFRRKGPSYIYVYIGREGTSSRSAWILGLSFLVSIGGHLCIAGGGWS